MTAMTSKDVAAYLRAARDKATKAKGRLDAIDGLDFGCQTDNVKRLAAAFMCPPPALPAIGTPLAHVRSVNLYVVVGHAFDRGEYRTIGRDTGHDVLVALELNETVLASDIDIDIMSAHSAIAEAVETICAHDKP